MSLFAPAAGDAAPPASEASTVEERAGALPGVRIAVGAPGRQPVNLYFEEHGQGPPLLLLHGLGESIFTWREILPALAARHRVIALDLKGFGHSEKPDDGAYSADDQADLVARFIVKQDLKDLIVVGHSFGGTVALRTALAEGIKGTGRIRRIVVISAPALPAATARYLDLVLTPLIPDTVAAVVPPKNVARFLLKEAMGGREPSDEIVDGYAQPYRNLDATRAFLATARSIVNERDTDAIVKRYRELREPVLVVWCRKDPIVSLRSGRKLAAALPRGRLAVLEKCHHLPQHERPKVLLSVLGAFLDR
ncbi:alpha/beta hydrolase [uncultured Hyphomicrobium sp.]|uniref:alpha/beta fold hydrolase n=1 Tax=uncultured Hyphomicrobium sp. TaxID=194373 RepID=UPI0025F87126|nr:alpha/beta hydrolase [uncultured Hyphomicrobium sp.]